MYVCVCMQRVRKGIYSKLTLKNPLSKRIYSFEDHCGYSRRIKLILSYFDSFGDFDEYDEVAPIEC